MCIRDRAYLLCRVFSQKHLAPVSSYAETIWHRWRKARYPQRSATQRSKPGRLCGAAMRRRSILQNHWASGQTPAPESDRSRRPFPCLLYTSNRRLKMLFGRHRVNAEEHLALDRNVRCPIPPSAMGHRTQISRTAAYDTPFLPKAMREHRVRRA